MILKLMTEKGDRFTIEQVFDILRALPGSIEATLEQYQGLSGMGIYIDQADELGYYTVSGQMSVYVAHVQLIANGLGDYCSCMDNYRGSVSEFLVLREPK